ncbi:MAG: tryptophan--tRNA ligase [Alphaproteobacteria bacterium]|nr:tryptophan--tRNA ligase [Alphaproteobacteria bacterium]
MKKQIILTGVQATGTPHIGNYVGAMRPMVEFSKSNDTIAFIADLHALNDVRDPKAIKQSTINCAATYIALGLDLNRTMLFRQSDVPEVLQLSSLLMNVTPKGMMNRAHAYKAVTDKNEAEGKDKDVDVNMGLYTYPILMAADILIYNSTLVPVGADQKQHIEFARDIAGSFNSIYGNIFTVPEGYIKEAAGLLPGLDGRKMSKSYGNSIQLFAPESELKKRVMQIVTDSKLPAEPKDPDSSIIFQIYSQFATDSEISELRKRFTDGGMGYGDAKNLLFEKLNSTLAGPREKYLGLLANPEQVEDILKSGAAKARPLAQETLARVKRAMLG